MARSGLDTTDLARRIGRAQVKDELRELTEEAIERGIFGVPSFVVENEIFWGQDRLPHLAARLEGRLDTPEELVQDWLARPRAVDRKASPLRRPE